ncbi:DUF1877 family protein [Paraflavitalea sp. CAU 1676]|uniref:DUF1877 family protein n=1 Tax=Paraflavitalea sp. CAU 1676 TaxID=3032598 RepID=UPI0023DC8F1D|nr:DUF1877 family protein [Paraflavitalea sp. CAU 1676]MDF2193787.1 DUF1877 family protein [Paraflavitalea sp. CAU 1676]
MGQSVTLYRVGKHEFRQLEQSAGRQQFEVSAAKNHVTFQGSFMGLEYVLSKGQDDSTVELVRGIFSPNQSLGGKDIEQLTLEEQFEFYESGGLVSYLGIDVISKLDTLFDTISAAEISERYDADEFNANGIYPEVWHKDNSADLGFNEMHLLTDFADLKSMIRQARNEQDYILVFCGE